MKTSDFYYDLPPELIAQTPLEKRDESRLLCLDKATGEWSHHHFYELPDFLRAGDCLILNNSRVLPARLLGHRLPGGGACEVLLLPYERLLLSDGSPAHQRVLQNLVRTISDKYFLLSRRVDLLVMKTLRAKVCAYLLSEAEQQGSMTFTIPFSRIQLADYLNCDRSALSRELSLMQRDGLLDTYRSSFKLLEPEALRQMIL